MASITISVPDLQRVGPIIEALSVAVGSPVEEALRAAKQPIPTPVQLVGMIDTGATGTVIQDGIAAKLRLQPVGTVYINTPSSANVLCYRYTVRFLFPNNVVVDSIVIEAPLQGQPIQCLIGRDILAHGVFVYIGYMNQFTLSF